MGCPEAKCNCPADYRDAAEEKDDDLHAALSEDIPLLRAETEENHTPCQTPRTHDKEDEGSDDQGGETGLPRAEAVSEGESRADAKQAAAPQRRRAHDAKSLRSRGTRGKDRKGSKRKAKSDKSCEDSQLVLCPICCGELGRSQEAIGALTYRGERVEPNLYHLGCISQMLCHSGSGSVGDGTGQQVLITWGTSPVTRRPVDGFLQMPPVEERTRWVFFVDWKQEGRVAVEEFAAATGALFPIGHRAIERFVRAKFRLGVGDSVENERLEAEVLPQVEMHCSQHTKGKDDWLSLSSNLNTIRVKDLCRRMECRRDCKQVGATRSSTSTSVNKHEVATLASELGEIADKGDMEVVLIAMQLFEDPEEVVRRAAVSLVSRVAVKDDPRVLDTISASLNHSVAEVRESAVRALELISRSDKQGVLELVAPFMKDASACVRAAAVLATAQLGEYGDVEVLQSIFPSLKDSDAVVRSAAFQAVAKISPKGHSDVVGALVAALKTSKGIMPRRSAAVALGKVAEKGDKTCFQAVAELLNEKDATVRKAAAHAMAMLGAKGDSDVLEAYLEAHKDKDPGVRKVVVESFPSLVDRGDPVAVRTACAWLKGETCADVRYGTIKTLAIISERGDRRAIKAVISQLGESDPYLRWKAITELANLAEVGDQRSIKAVGCHLQESNSTVRAAAAEVLGELAHSKDARAIWNVSQYLKDCDPAVKRCAECALEKIKSREPPRSLALVACHACVPWLRRPASSPESPAMVTVMCSSTGSVQNVPVALPYSAESER